MRRLLFAPVAAVVVSSVLAPAGAEAAATPPCSYGDARATFETATEVGSLPPCTFRLFWDGQTLPPFPEGNVVVGGIAFSAPYANQAERAGALAEMEGLSVRVWLADATTPNAPLVEQPVGRTAIKEAHSEEDGRYLWMQTGVILDLPPGEYLVVTKPSWESTSWTVRLVVTPVS